MIGTTWMIHGCRLHIEHGENHKCLFELFDIPYRPYRPHNHDASTKFHEYRKYVDRVVTALLKNQTGLTKQHVPYRDCSLTWLMSKCLGGNSYAVSLFDNLSEDTAIEFSGIENKPTLSIPTLSHATPFQQ